MKKYFIVLVVLLLPISTLAKQESKEELLKIIDDIHNVVVDEEVEILSTEVEDDSIVFDISEGGITNTHHINYQFLDNHLSFNSGYFLLNNNTKGVSIDKVKNNQYAFYLYSILENLSTAPYEEENYYNEKQIYKIINRFNYEEIVKDSSWKKEYTNTGKTFGIQFIREKLDNNQIKVNIVYQYYLDGDDTIVINPMVEERREELLRNPETGNYSFFVTIVLFIVVGLAGYTYINPREE